jgi:hypothetical protein
LHHARALVPEDHREQTFRIGARARELVGVTHAGRLQLDQHLARFRPLQVHRFDDERLALLIRNGCLGLHGGGQYRRPGLDAGNLTAIERPPSGSTIFDQN